MKVQLNGKLRHLADLDPGTLFVTRTNEFTTIGLAATYGYDRAAVLFNMARYPGQPSPCLVAESALGGVPLITLPEAMLVPALSQETLQFSSTVTDGPGMLMLFADNLFLRVSREGSGFAYVDVESGIAGATPSQAAVEIPRWSIQQPNAAGQFETLFEFSGPAPIVRP
ncbi:MAG: hypothetical protein E8A46_08680 [Bradyrhizobium sp.]|jgi:hypothetical protein|uniref:hypothetical protein n=1 Tax=Bradyrhizobium sp. TaxID=376 RepID=UPI0012072EA9|nr:hypothetical protein [Bradyrhizobium sp.]THD54502.1 MAG: hypothetical protein E8A46_08680 [Bradyrhizobium sp.]